MSISSRFPDLFPSLLLDFQNSKRLDPRITFSRASSATYFDDGGVLQSAAAGQARFDHDPVNGDSRGFLIEEQRTNSIRNNTMQGAVAGTPGTLPTNWQTFTSLTGLTREIVGTGTENGITYIDIKLSGTPSAAGAFNIFQEAVTATAAVSGQVWAFTQYSKLAAGSTTGISSLQNGVIEYSAASAFLTQGVTNFTPTTAGINTQRYGHTRTLTNASTAFIRSTIQLNLTGVAIDITLRIGLPQLEQGAFATSVIPTSGTALTRNADAASMDGTNFSSWFNAAEGTFVGIGASNLAASKVQFFLAADTNTQNYISLARFNSATGGTSRIVDANSIVADMALGTLTTLVPFKLATAYKVDDFASSTNGAAAVTDTLGTIPTVNKLSIGNVNGTIQINGHIQRIAYYPTRLSNAQLQALTA